MSLRSQVSQFIYANPGLTQLEIARSIYGSAADRGQVTRICRELVREGHVQRLGRGGTGDPYRYHWIRQMADEILHDAAISLTPPQRDFVTAARLG